MHDKANAAHAPAGAAEGNDSTRKEPGRHHTSETATAESIDIATQRVEPGDASPAHPTTVRVSHAMHMPHIALVEWSAATPDGAESGLFSVNISTPVIVRLELKDSTRARLVVATRNECPVDFTTTRAAANELYSDLWSALSQARVNYVMHRQQSERGRRRQQTQIGAKPGGTADRRLPPENRATTASAPTDTASAQAQPAPAATAPTAEAPTTQRPAGSAARWLRVSAVIVMIGSGLTVAAFVGALVLAPQLDTAGDSVADTGIAAQNEDRVAPQRWTP